MSVLSARAQLTWERHEIEITPALDATRVEVNFPFENKSDHAIKITSVDASCGCVLPKSEKEAYAPGEKGDLIAFFDIGHREGDQNKVIRLETSDAREPVVILRFIVHIRSILELLPIYLHWMPGEKNDPKTINIRFVEKAEMDLKLGDIPNAFKVELSTRKDGREFELLVAPKEMTKPVFSGLDIEAVLSGKTVRKYRVYFQVRTKAPQSIGVPRGCAASKLGRYKATAAQAPICPKLLSCKEAM